MAIFPARHRLTIILLALLIFSFFFFITNLRYPSSSSFFEEALFSLAAYIQKGFAKVVSYPVSVWEKYTSLLRAEETYRIIAKENDALRQENASLRELSLSTNRLRDLLEFKKTSPLRLVPAEVVGVDASTYFKSIVIDKGTAAGVKKDMAVISPRGAVGRILKVTDSFSMVILLIDQNFALDALVQRSRARGIVEGVGDSSCHMKYILRSDDVRETDLVVASGLEGVFPKGTIVGQVVSVKSDTPSPFKDVIVGPSVDFKKLEEVLVVTER
jgi:rod shape-determining protein MreC